MDRETLIDAAIGANENYRVNEDGGDMEIGFLYGTAELITVLTLQQDESYSLVREKIAHQTEQQEK